MNLKRSSDMLSSDDDDVRPKKQVRFTIDDPAAAEDMAIQIELYPHIAADLKDDEKWKNPDFRQLAAKAFTNCVDEALYVGKTYFEEKEKRCELESDYEKLALKFEELLQKVDVYEKEKSGNEWLLERAETKIESLSRRASKAEKLSVDLMHELQKVTEKYETLKSRSSDDEASSLAVGNSHNPSELPEVQSFVENQNISAPVVIKDEEDLSIIWESKPNQATSATTSPACGSSDKKVVRRNSRATATNPIIESDNKMLLQHYENYLKACMEKDERIFPICSKNYFLFLTDKGIITDGKANTFLTTYGKGKPAQKKLKNDFEQWCMEHPSYKFPKNFCDQKLGLKKLLFTTTNTIITLSSS